MSLKSKIRNLAKDKNISAQVILQNYMFERLLERLSVSEYKENIVLKGGMLVAAMVGIDNRATMDMDATLKSYPLTEQSVLQVLTDICNMQLFDDVSIHVIKALPIRKDDIYGGLRVSLEAVYDTIITPISIDISTGDAITPAAVWYKFHGMFDEEKEIEVLAYNIETIFAEKFETILRRGVFSTRPRDLYDVYILLNTQEYDKSIFKSAFWTTAEHRGSTSLFDNIDDILAMIENSAELL